DHCPTGVATQDPARWRALDVEDKAARVHNFHQNTLRALRDMLGAAGLEHPSQLGPEHILRRVAPTEVRSLAALYRFLAPGELLDGVPEHAVFRAFWASARPDSFMPPERTLEMRRSKLLSRPASRLKPRPTVRHRLGSIPDATGYRLRPRLPNGQGRMRSAWPRSATQGACLPATPRVPRDVRDTGQGTRVRRLRRGLRGGAHLCPPGPGILLACLGPDARPRALPAAARK